MKLFFDSGTSVVNLKHSDYDVYIGRGSKWGNPYTSKESKIAKFKVKTREEAIAKYKEYILYGEGNHLLKELHELKGKKLGCFCKPLKCHGDILVELLDDSEKE